MKAGDYKIYQCNNFSSPLPGDQISLIFELKMKNQPYSEHAS